MTLPVVTTANRPAQSSPERTREARSPWISRNVALGSLAPRMNSFAFVRGQYMTLDSSSLSGRWLALCFPGSLHSAITASVNRQTDALSQEGVLMLIVLSDTRLFRLSDRQDLHQFTAPIVTDPLQRLHRMYGAQRHFPFSDLTTFVIGPDRILRFKFDHALTGMDCEILRAVLRTTPSTLRTDEGSTTPHKEVPHALCTRA